MKNQFKAALQDEKRVQIGLWLALASAYCAELCATGGFDWLVVDGEHAPNDVRSILAQLQAVAPYPGHAVVRPTVGDVPLIKQLLDIGAQTLLVPMIETAEQAVHMVAATRYPPAGVRGVGAAIARASRWNAIPTYLRDADSEICLLVQVESAKALSNLDAIAGVEGIDGVFIGPADLAASLGHRGNTGHPVVQSAIEDGVRRIMAAGKPAGILSVDEIQARRYIELGCRFVAVGVDVTLLARSTRELAAKFIPQAT